MTNVQRPSWSSSESCKLITNCGFDANVSMKFLHPPAVVPSIQDPLKCSSFQAFTDSDSSRESGVKLQISRVSKYWKKYTES